MAKLICYSAGYYANIVMQMMVNHLLASGAWAELLTILGVLCKTSETMG